ncbi:general secretion pathway protein K [Ferrovum myxofaciens]|uniref:Type II secretion system protein K n=1 Tax=Ferrovum myxofaciens TaxID=416213 RepID=A0A149VYX7_9PROT|nr:type II secretion system minor pseudopilin GspK [Ferrovum myxofaciens]KXW58439.1 general secretion pathway protein K [Ferrovum myxofaciens]
MRQERGAALLMALLLAILVAVLASGMMQDEQRRVKLLENQRVRDEAEQMGVGALDWARLILREDLLHTGAVDHLGEVWAVPITDIPLESVTGGGGASGIRLSGRILDAQSRFNLMSLVKVANLGADQGWVGATAIDPDGVAVFQRLLQSLGLDPAVAPAIAAQILASRSTAPPPSGSTSTPDPFPARQITDQSTGAPLPLGIVSEVRTWFPDADAATLARLESCLVILPHPTQVNANTASASVLGAVLGVDPGTLTGLLQGRQQQIFSDTADLQRRVNTLLPNLGSFPSSQLGVSSDYFWVVEELRRPGAVQRRQALVARHQGVGQMTQVLEWHRGWTPGMDLTGGG